MWEFPGGKIGKSETATDCIKREIMEELEIEVEIQNKLISIKFDYLFKQIELIPFLCSIKSGEIKLNEHEDYKGTSINSFLSRNK